MTPPRVSAHRAAPLPSGAAGTSDTITSGAGYSTIACVKLLMCPSCVPLFSANQVSFVFASAITDGAAEAVGIGYSSTVWSVFDIEPMEFLPGSVNQIRPEAESGETHAGALPVMSVGDSVTCGDRWGMTMFPAASANQPRNAVESKNMPPTPALVVGSGVSVIVPDDVMTPIVSAFSENMKSVPPPISVKPM